MTPSQSKVLRKLAYGYRLGEVPLPRPGPTKNIKLKFRKGYDAALRKIQQVSLGCHVAGLTAPHPDTDDPFTLLAGGLKRAYALPPGVDEGLVQEFHQHVRKKVKELFTPLDPGADTTVETWLRGRPYPEWRKQELMKAWLDDLDRDSQKHYRVGAFGKDETYPEWKHARLIHARSDVAKCRFGPIFSLIEAEVFKHPSFIKKVPVSERARYILEKLSGLDGRKIHSTDYSSFEAWFTKEMMEACEFTLYEHMTRDLAEGQSFMSDLRKHVAGDNHINTKYWSAKVPATRMSGEMCTSLGNGFTNWMITDFLITRMGGTYDGVFEGDDGLVVSTVWPEDTMFTKLGMSIKCEEHEDLASASFCGLIFDPEERVVVANPLTYLVNFGWTNRRLAGVRRGKLMAMLRAKSMSLAYQFPGCPVLDSLARYGLRVTRSYDARSFIENTHHLGQWQYERLIEAASSPLVSKAVGLKTRILVERKFGISVLLQLRLEAYLDGLNDVQPLELDLLDSVDHPFLAVARENDQLYTEVADPSRATTMAFPYSREWFLLGSVPKLR